MKPWYYVLKHNFIFADCRNLKIQTNFEKIKSTLLNDMSFLCMRVIVDQGQWMHVEDTCSLTRIYQVKVTTHLWCTYTAHRKSNLSRRVSVNNHVSNICRFLFQKKLFFLSVCKCFRLIWNHSLRKFQKSIPGIDCWRENENSKMNGKSCRELLKRVCKKNCTRQCRCKKYQLRCKELCRCAGNCNNWISF